MNSVGERLRRVRLRRSYSQAELAKISGVSAVTITRLVSRTRPCEPHPQTIRKLAAALGVDPAWLLFGEGADGQ